MILTKVNLPALDLFAYYIVSIVKDSLAKSKPFSKIDSET